MLGRYISQQNGGVEHTQQKKDSGQELKRKLDLMEKARQENNQ